MSEDQIDKTRPSDFGRAMNSMLDNLERFVVLYEKISLEMLERIEELESSEDSFTDEAASEEKDVSAEEMEQPMNDTTISVAGSNGHLELNAFKPLIISTFLESVTLIADACRAFGDNCVAGIEPVHDRIEKNLKNSLMLVTALNKHLGYEKAAKIARKAHEYNITLKEAALRFNLLTEEQYDEWVVPADMIHPSAKKK